MNKKVLFTIVPSLLVMGVLVGCKTNVKEYTVKFDTDGGTTIADVKVKEGNKVSRPSTDPVKTDYTFTDWYTTKDGNDKFNFDTAIKVDTTIYAHYTKATPTLEGVVAKLKVAKEYKVGETITKNDITVTATYKDKSTKEVTDWTCSDIKDDKGYTFTKEDATASQKQFNISYGGLETMLEVGVVEGDPEYIKYLEFSVYSSEIQVKRKSGGTLPTNLVIPDKVKGKYVKDYITEGLEAETDYNVTWIKSYGFDNTNITSVSIPNTINAIQESAFAECSSLSTVTFAADSVLTSINEYAFDSCSSLKNITLPDSLEALQDGAFSGSGITTFTIPSKVTSIGENALVNESTSLTSLTFDNTTGTWIIAPIEKTVEEYSVDTATKNAEKYNSCKKRWAKNQLSILFNNKSETTFKKGDKGSVSFASPLAGETINNVYTTDENKLYITEDEGWKFEAKSAGTAKVVLESDYDRYGIVDVTISESLTGTVTIACATPGVGQVITASVTGAQTTNLKYTWYSSSAGSEPLYESTSNTYTLVATDNYSYFSLEVTDSTGEYVGKITSNDLYINW